jgi:GAF domain-containing protein
MRPSHSVLTSPLRLDARRLGCGLATVCGLLLVAGILWMAHVRANDPWSDSRIEESKAIGDEIVAALEKYKADKGIYPAKLEDLAPRYLGRLRAPTAGTQQWDYVRTSGGRFYNLGFYESTEIGSPHYGRFSENDYWDYDDGSI